MKYRIQFAARAKGDHARDVHLFSGIEAESLADAVDQIRPLFDGPITSDVLNLTHDNAVIERLPPQRQ